MSQELAKAPAYLWSGCYSTWGEACKAAKESAAAETFCGERWKGRITQQLLDYRKEFQQYGVAMPPRPSSMPLFYALHPVRSIVDLGGSSGWCWDYLNNTLPENQVSSYVVVELAEVANYMAGAGFHGKPVQYRTLKDALEPCDLLYSNSVLQYFESNAELLTLARNVSPRWILLEDLLSHAGEDFFTTQPYFNSAIPYRIVGVRQLLAELSLLGYRKIFQAPYASPVHGVVQPFETGNFPEEKRFRYSWSLLLTKGDSDEG